MRQNNFRNLSRGRPRISIVGLGYVGLCTAVCFADRGFRVYGVESDREKRDRIMTGTPPFHEPGLKPMLRSVLRRGLFTCDTDSHEAVLESEVTFVTVGTPSKSSGGIDTRYVESAAGKIGETLAAKSRYHTVVMKSTVVPGTTEGLIKEILEKTSGKSTPDSFGLCANPEFLREGSAIDDMVNPDALIIGASNERAAKILLDLYRKFYGNTLPPTVMSSISSCEFVKYAVNTFRATQLSFINMLANACERTPSADIVDVVRGLGAVTKIDSRYMRAGFGYGGSCLPKDLRALTTRIKELDGNPTLLEAAAQINTTQPLRVCEIVRDLIGEIEGKKIALLGLAFKAGTDDVRESVAIRIANALSLAGAQVFAYDPKAMDNAKPFLDRRVDLAGDLVSCLAGAECCIVATEWPEFRSIHPNDVMQLMKYPAIIDGKRIFDHSKFELAGVRIMSLGRHNEYSQSKPLGELVAADVPNRKREASSHRCKSR